MLISDDGFRFSKVYLLVNDSTGARFFGLLKGHGYPYLCCTPDGQRLLVSFTINKEDIECGAIDPDAHLKP